jgi:hypothetical protein
MTTFYLGMAGGSYGSVFKGPNFTNPDCVPTASHLDPASRKTDEEVMDAPLGLLSGLDFSKLKVGDQIVHGYEVPTWASLQSLALCISGAPGMTLSRSWEKGFAPGAATHTDSFSTDGTGACVHATAAAPTNIEATAVKTLYVERYDTNATGNMAAKADRVIFTVVALPTTIGDLNNLKIQMRLNYLTHANCHKFRVCACVGCP